MLSFRTIGNRYCHFLLLAHQWFNRDCYHDRIRLYYGETYGIVIDSFPERGTVVTLSYPSDGGPDRENGKETEN